MWHSLRSRVAVLDQFVAGSKRNGLVVLLVFLFSLTILAAGCPGESSLGAPKDVDLAVGDLGVGDVDDSQVLIYTDVLSEGSQQDADIIITKQDFSRLRDPYSIQLAGDFSGNDLYVADYQNSLVAIWRDYRDLAAKAGGDRAPNVVLDYASSSICNPSKIVHADNRLYVLSRHGDCSSPNPSGLGTGLGRVSIFDHIGAVTTGHGDTPSLVLDGLQEPNSMAVNGDTLYVALHGGVHIYEDLAERLQGTYSGDPTLPSVVLGPSSFVFDDYPRAVEVFDDRLYVGASPGIYVFDNAGALIDDQAPSAILGDSTYSVSAANMAVVGDTIYSALYVPDTDKSNAGALEQSAAAKDALSGASAMKLDTLSTFDKSVRQFDNTCDFSKEGRVLFACRNAYGEPVGTVCVYFNANIPKSEDSYTFCLTPLKDFTAPNAIDTNRFYTLASAK